MCHSFKNNNKKTEERIMLIASRAEMKIEKSCEKNVPVAQNIANIFCEHYIFFLRATYSTVKACFIYPISHQIYWLI